MVQKLFGLGLGATGIVGVLIVAGIIISKLNISAELGKLALSSGIIIGIILGVLGVIGVLRRMF